MSKIQLHSVRLFMAHPVFLLEHMRACCVADHSMRDRIHIQWAASFLRVYA